MHDVGRKQHARQHTQVSQRMKRCFRKSALAEGMQALGEPVRQREMDRRREEERERETEDERKRE